MFAYIYCMKRIVTCIILWCLVLSWMGSIFYFSHQTAAQSSEISTDIATKLYENVDLTPKKFEDKKEYWLIDHYEIFLRKAAHFSQYLILAILLSAALKLHIKSICKVSVLSFIVGTLYAISDEIHQHFIPGRTARMIDVIIDLSGVAIGCLFVWLTVKLINKIKKNKSE